MTGTEGVRVSGRPDEWLLERAMDHEAAGSRRCERRGPCRLPLGPRALAPLGPRALAPLDPRALARCADAGQDGGRSAIRDLYPGWSG